ncbi:YbfB/YjiJ family MFS transporter [Rhodovarius crocodyli]|uniref:YbfB/YjiJ family MFS transporter n=1 Tax=Rhodovarius crocodyli TaxID=1979269 RepID=A0A437MNG8_9PROT|nr:YbfB/YjiJ family MFS transporter [Rhodovarius crocodyli]RVT99194.1 YbfB/YjiJ family MFS transporter [Rhodovarius crocodyli]
MASPAWSGAAATFIGNGLARFAFVPLFPAMVAAGWVDGTGAGLLGATALAGYLPGVLMGQFLARRLGTARVLDLAVLLLVIGFLACCWNGGLWWLLPWRGLAGVAGGWIMAVAPPAAQLDLPPERRAMAAGMVIAGVAGGILAGALAMPWLLTWGPGPAWIGLGVIAACLWLVARRSAPRSVLPALAGGRGWSPLLTAYLLSSIGMVAPMVYLSDLIARGHGLGVGAGAYAWAMFGAGGLVGALLSGRVASAIGSARAVMGWLMVQVGGLALLCMPWHALAWPGAAMAGFAGVGVTAVLLVLLRERYGPDAAALWARGTAGYAVGQAVGAFVLAGLFGLTRESHLAVFAVGLLFSASAALMMRRAMHP